MPLNNAGKVCVILSSLLLGCGYVGYRHTEQTEKITADQPTMLPSSKNPNRITVLPGSKSIDAVLKNPQRQRTGSDFILPLSPPDEGAKKEGKRILMPSSKIGPILKQEDTRIIDREAEDILDEGWRETPPP